MAAIALKVGTPYIDSLLKFTRVTALTDCFGVLMAYRSARENTVQRAAAQTSSRGLSDREAEVFQWVATGKSDWEISQILGISSKTVNFHVENVKRKYGVATRIQALVAVVRNGEIDG